VTVTEEVTESTIRPHHSTSQGRTPLRDYYSKSEKLNFESELNTVKERI